MKIFYELFQGTKRFGELQRLLPQVSRHVLTVQLRELEESGIVQRTVYPTVPPKVEYALTDFGRSWEALVEQMVAKGEEYIAISEEKKATRSSP